MKDDDYVAEWSLSIQ